MIMTSSPPDHIISSIIVELQQAILDGDLDEIEILLTKFNLYKNTSLDLLKYDHSELSKTLKITRKFIEPKSQPTPTPATQHILHPSDLQTVSMTRAEWRGLSYDF